MLGELLQAAGLPAAASIQPLTGHGFENEVFAVELADGRQVVLRRCRLLGFEDFAWRARYYEHIIRSERSLDAIRRYITDNPARWQDDADNSANL